MQITINAPDNLPHDFIELQIKELEAKLKQHANRLISGNTSTKEQAIMQISKRCANLPELDHRSSDHILGYEDSAMGLWGDE
jgi:DNA integrity scanning protein DisA with diadenylate cyclase activity